jgi:CDP-glucose 4,6-dehydratase
MSNIFVTGGSGFIGSHVCQKLSEKNQVVTLVRDLFPTTTPWGKWLSEALNRTQIVLGNILNYSTLRRVLADYSIDTVYHLAACAVVSTAQKDPCGTFQTNVVGTVNMLEACRQLDIPAIYIQSTDKVYGERMDATEADPLVSTGPYETSKACADLTAQSFMETYGMNIVIGRPCNTYGYDMAKRIIPNTIKACLKGEPPIIYEGEEKAVRQYIHVCDLVSAILFLIRGNHRGIYNIGTDDVKTQDEVVRQVCRFFPMSPRYMKRDKPIKEITQQTIDWTKIRNLGWVANLYFTDGIKLTIDAFSKYGC